jgi:uncharacterized protein YdiU (UPF0061 family)
MARREIGEMRRRKLGLAAWDDAAEQSIWHPLQRLMQSTPADYTLLWRQLARIGDAEGRVAAGGEGAAADAALAHMYEAAAEPS